MPPTDPHDRYRVSDPLGRIEIPLPPSRTVPPLNRTLDEEFTQHLVDNWSADLGGEQAVRTLIAQALEGRDQTQLKNPRPFLTYSLQQAAKQARR